MQAEFYYILNLQKLLLYSALLRIYLYEVKNNDNNDDVAYAPLDLTLALMRATNDNVLQHCRHLLHIHFNDLHKCALRSKN